MKGLFYKKSKRHMLMCRSAAFITCLVFIWTTLMGEGTSYAESIRAALNSELSFVSPHQTFLKLPKDLGQIKSFNESSDPDAPFIVHIQDAHANLDAQKSIKGILDWVKEHKETQFTVALEGAGGELHPEYLSFFSEYPKVNQEIADRLFEMGELNGVELFAWEQLKANDKSSARIVGVEEATLYRKNLTAYRKLLHNQEPLEKELAKKYARLEKELSRSLSKPLWNFLKERKRRKLGDYGSENDAPQWQTYLTFLKRQVLEHLEIDLSQRFEQIRFPNIVRVLVLGDFAGQTNDQQIRIEKRELLKQIKQKIRRKDEKEIVHRFEHIELESEPRTVVEGFWRVANSRGVALNDYKELWNYIGEVVLTTEIESEAFQEEMAQLEKGLIAKHIRSEGEQELVQQLDDLGLVEKLLHLKLMRSEHEDLTRRKEEVLNRVFAQDYESWQRALETAFDFYELAFQRDHELIKNTLEAAKGSDLVFLVAGGFHTEGLESLMKQKRLGYAVIQPAIKKIGEEDLYQKVLREENIDMSAYFDQPYLGKQEALFLKQTLETAIPELWDEYNVPHTEIGEKVAAVINSHPVMSSRIEASAEVDGNGSKLLLHLKPEVELVEEASSAVGAGKNGNRFLALAAILQELLQFKLRYGTGPSGRVATPAVDNRVVVLIRPAGTQTRVQQLAAPSATFPFRDRLSVAPQQPKRSEIRSDQLKDSWVLVLPGAGVQVLQMGKVLYDRDGEYPQYKAAIDAASDVLGYNLADRMFAADDDALGDPRLQYVAISVSLYGLYKVLEAQLGDDLPIGAIYGMSMGQITANMIAETISFRDGVLLSQKYGEEFHRASVETPGQLLQVRGKDLSGVKDILAANDVHIAIDYGIDGRKNETLILSGTPENVAKIVSAAEGMQRVTTRVLSNGGVAAHTPLLADANTRVVTELMESVEIRDPKPGVAVIGNINTNLLTTAADIREELSIQLVSPINWRSTVDSIVSNGATRVLELGVGSSGFFSRLLKDDPLETSYVEAPSENTPTNLTEFVGANKRSEVRLDTRRRFLQKAAAGLGTAALSGVLSSSASVAQDQRAYRPSRQTVEVIQKGLSGVGRFIRGPDAPGVHRETGVPRDNVQRDAKGNPTALADFSAPSKWGTYLMTLYHVAEGNPMVSGFNMSKEEALEDMLVTLKWIRNIQNDPDGKKTFAGLGPWHKIGIDMKPEEFAGNLIVPTLDNSQTTMPLMGIVGAYFDAEGEGRISELRREAAQVADEILENQDYSKFKSPNGGRLWAAWDVANKKGLGNPQPEHMWTEWAMPHLLSFLEGDISEETWLSLYSGTNTETLDIPGVGPVDLPDMHTWSMHEVWILQYLSPILMESELAPFYHNIALAQTKWSQDNDLPGLVASEFSTHGQYIPAGPNFINMEGETKDPYMVTPYATAFAALINPELAEWMTYLFDPKLGVVTDYGFTTSWRRGDKMSERDAGPSWHYSADNTFGTVNAMAEWYLRAHPEEAKNYRNISDGIVRYYARRMSKKSGKPVSEEDARNKMKRAFDLQAQAIKKRWQSDPKTLPDNVREIKLRRKIEDKEPVKAGEFRVPKYKDVTFRASYKSQTAKRNRILARHGLQDKQGEILSPGASVVLGPPPEERRNFSVAAEHALTELPESVSLIGHLVEPDRHASRMRVPAVDRLQKAKVFETDTWVITPEGEIYGDYEMGPEDTFAFLGTHVLSSIPLAIRDTNDTVQKYGEFSLWINTTNTTTPFEVELKTRTGAVYRIYMDPSQDGEVDGDWKKLTGSFEIDEKRTFDNGDRINYVALSAGNPHEPNARFAAKGTIHVKDLQVHLADSRSEVRTPFDIQKQYPKTFPGTQQLVSDVVDWLIDDLRYDQPLAASGELGDDAVIAENAQILREFNAAIQGAEQLTGADLVFGKYKSGGEWKMGMGIEAIHQILGIARDLESHDLFIEFIASVVVREAEGWRIARAADELAVLNNVTYSDTFKPLVYPDGDERLSLSWPSDSLEDALRTNSTELEKLVASSIAFEVYETERQRNFLTWATGKSLYDKGTLDAALSERTQLKQFSDFRDYHLKPLQTDRSIRDIATSELHKHTIHGLRLMGARSRDVKPTHIAYVLYTLLGSSRGDMRMEDVNANVSKPPTEHPDDLFKAQTRRIAFAVEDNLRRLETDYRPTEEPDFDARIDEFVNRSHATVSAEADTSVYVIGGFHTGLDDLRRDIVLADSLLPPIPEQIIADEDLPEVVVHLENSHLGFSAAVLNDQRLIQQFDIQNDADAEGFKRAYVWYMEMFEQVQAAAFAELDEGRMPAREVTFDNYHFQINDLIFIQFEQILRLKQLGYKVKVYSESPSPDAWWLTTLTVNPDAPEREAFIYGQEERFNRETIVALELRLNELRLRDFEGEGPKINERIRNHPKATHIVYRGLGHLGLIDMVEAPEGKRKQLIYGTPRGELGLTFLSPSYKWANSRRRQLPSFAETSTAHEFGLRKEAFNIMVGRVRAAGVTDGRLLYRYLNQTVNRLSEQDLRRVMRSMNDPRLGSHTLPQRSSEALARIFHNFPHAFPERSIERHLVERALAEYNPVSTEIPEARSEVRTMPRREFLTKSARGVGALGLASLFRISAAEAQDDFFRFVSDPDIFLNVYKRNDVIHASDNADEYGFWIGGGDLFESLPQPPHRAGQNLVLTAQDGWVMAFGQDGAAIPNSPFLRIAYISESDIQVRAELKDVNDQHIIKDPVFELPNTKGEIGTITFNLTGIEPHEYARILDRFAFADVKTKDVNGQWVTDANVKWTLLSGRFDRRNENIINKGNALMPKVPAKALYWHDGKFVEAGAIEGRENRIRAGVIDNTPVADILGDHPQGVHGYQTGEGQLFETMVGYQWSDAYEFSKLPTYAPDARLMLRKGPGKIEAKFKKPFDLKKAGTLNLSAANLQPGTVEVELINTQGESILGGPVKITLEGQAKGLLYRSSHQLLDLAKTQNTQVASIVLSNPDQDLHINEGTFAVDGTFGYAETYYYRAGQWKKGKDIPGVVRQNTLEPEKLNELPDLLIGTEGFYMGGGDLHEQGKVKNRRAGEDIVINDADTGWAGTHFRRDFVVNASPHWNSQIVTTKPGIILLELKMSQEHGEHLLHDLPKIPIVVPNTNGKPLNISIDLRGVLKPGAGKAHFLFISRDEATDPEADSSLRFKRSRFESEPTRDAQVYAWDEDKSAFVAVEARSEVRMTSVEPAEDKQPEKIDPEQVSRQIQRKLYGRVAAYSVTFIVANFFMTLAFGKSLIWALLYNVGALVSVTGLIKFAISLYAFWMLNKFLLNRWAEIQPERYPDFVGEESQAGFESRNEEAFRNAPAWLVMTLGIFMGPMLQEIALRGWVLPMISAMLGSPIGYFGVGPARFTLGVFIGIAVASFLYAFLQKPANKKEFVDRLITGGVLGVSYVASGSVLVPMAISVANNYFSFIDTKARVDAELGEPADSRSEVRMTDPADDEGEVVDAEIVSPEEVSRNVKRNLYGYIAGYSAIFVMMNFYMSSMFGKSLISHLFSNLWALVSVTAFIKFAATLFAFWMFHEFLLKRWHDIRSDRFPEFGQGDPRDAVRSRVDLSLRNAPTWLVMTVAVFMGPIMEEILFRGLMLPMFSSMLGTPIGYMGVGPIWLTFGVFLAIVGTTYIFAWRHRSGSKVSFVNRLITGGVLGISYVISGSILVPMIIHVMNNYQSIMSAKRKIDAETEESADSRSEVRIDESPVNERPTITNWMGSTLPMPIATWQKNLMDGVFYANNAVIQERSQYYERMLKGLAVGSFVVGILFQNMGNWLLMGGSAIISVVLAIYAYLHAQGAMARLISSRGESRGRPVLASTHVSVRNDLFNLRPYNEFSMSPDSYVRILRAGGFANLFIGLASLALGIYILAMHGVQAPFVELIVLALSVLMAVNLIFATQHFLYEDSVYRTPRSEKKQAKQNKRIAKMVEEVFNNDADGIGKVIGIRVAPHYQRDFSTNQPTIIQPTFKSYEPNSFFLLAEQRGVRKVYRVEKIFRGNAAAERAKFLYEADGVVNNVLPVGPAVPYAVEGELVSRKDSGRLSTHERFSFQARRGEMFVLYEIDMPEDLMARLSPGAVQRSEVRDPQPQEGVDYFKFEFFARFVGVLITRERHQEAIAEIEGRGRSVNAERILSTITTGREQIPLEDLGVARLTHFVGIHDQNGDVDAFNTDAAQAQYPYNYDQWLATFVYLLENRQTVLEEARVLFGFQNEIPYQDPEIPSETVGGLVREILVETQVNVRVQNLAASLRSGANSVAVFTAMAQLSHWPEIPQILNYVFANTNESESMDVIRGLSQAYEADITATNNAVYHLVKNIDDKEARQTLAANVIAYFDTPVDGIILPEGIVRPFELATHTNNLRYERVQIGSGIQLLDSGASPAIDRSAVADAYLRVANLHQLKVSVWHPAGESEQPTAGVQREIETESGFRVLNDLVNGAWQGQTAPPEKTIQFYGQLKQHILYVVHRTRSPLVLMDNYERLAYLEETMADYFKALDDPREEEYRVNADNWRKDLYEERFNVERELGITELQPPTAGETPLTVHPLILRNLSEELFHVLTTSLWRVERVRDVMTEVFDRYQEGLVADLFAVLELFEQNQLRVDALTRTGAVAEAYYRYVRDGSTTFDEDIAEVIRRRQHLSIYDGPVEMTRPLNLMPRAEFESQHSAGVIALLTGQLRSEVRHDPLRFEQFTTLISALYNTPPIMTVVTQIQFRGAHVNREQLLASLEGDDSVFHFDAPALGELRTAVTRMVIGEDEGVGAREELERLRGRYPLDEGMNWQQFLALSVFYLENYTELTDLIEEMLAPVGPSDEEYREFSLDHIMSYIDHLRSQAGQEAADIAAIRERGLDRNAATVTLAAFETPERLLLDPASVEMVGLLASTAALASLEMPEHFLQLFSDLTGGPDIAGIMAGLVYIIENHEHHLRHLRVHASARQVLDVGDVEITDSIRTIVSDLVLERDRSERMATLARWLRPEQDTPSSAEKIALFAAMGWMAHWPEMQDLFISIFENSTGEHEAIVLDELQSAMERDPMNTMLSMELIIHGIPSAQRQRLIGGVRAAFPHGGRSIGPAVMSLVALAVLRREAHNSRIEGGQILFAYQQTGQEQFRLQLYEMFVHMSGSHRTLTSQLGEIAREVGQPLASVEIEQNFSAMTMVIANTLESDTQADEEIERLYQRNSQLLQAQLNQTRSGLHRIASMQDLIHLEDIYADYFGITGRLELEEQHRSRADGWRADLYDTRIELEERAGLLELPLPEPNGQAVLIHPLHLRNYTLQMTDFGAKAGWSLNRVLPVGARLLDRLHAGFDDRLRSWLDTQNVLLQPVALTLVGTAAQAHFDVWSGAQAEYQPAFEQAQTWLNELSVYDQPEFVESAAEFQVPTREAFEGGVRDGAESLLKGRSEVRVDPSIYPYLAAGAVAVAAYFMLPLIFENGAANDATKWLRKTRKSIKQDAKNAGYFQLRNVVNYVKTYHRLYESLKKNRKSRPRIKQAERVYKLALAVFRESLVAIEERAGVDVRDHSFFEVSSLLFRIGHLGGVDYPRINDDIRDFLSSLDSIEYRRDVNAEAIAALKNHNRIAPVEEVAVRRSEIRMALNRRALIKNTAATLVSLPFLELLGGSSAEGADRTDYVTRLIEYQDLLEDTKRNPPGDKDEERALLRRMERAYRTSNETIHRRIYGRDIRFRVSEVQRSKDEKEKEKVTREVIDLYETTVQEEGRLQVPIAKVILEVMRRTRNPEILILGADILIKQLGEKFGENFFKQVHAPIILSDKEVRDPKDPTKVLTERGDRRIKTAIEDHKKNLRVELQLALRLIAGMRGPLKAELARRKPRSDNAEKAYAAMKAKIKGLRDSRDKMKAPIPSAKRTIKELVELVAIVEDRSDANEIAKQRARLEEARENLQKIEIEISATGKQIARLESDELPALSKERIAASAGVRDLEKLVTNLDRVYANLKASYYKVPTLSLDIPHEEGEIPSRAIFYNNKLETVRQLLDAPITILGMTDVVEKELKTAGIEKIGDLFEKTDQELYQLFAGRSRTVPYFSEHLAKVGLKLPRTVIAKLDKPETDSRSEVRADISRRRALQIVAGLTAVPAVDSLVNLASADQRSSARGALFLEYDNLLDEIRNNPPSTEKEELAILEKMRKAFVASNERIRDRSLEQDIRFRQTQIESSKEEKEKIEVTREIIDRFQDVIDGEALLQQPIAKIILEIARRTQNPKTLTRAAEILDAQLKAEFSRKFFKDIYGPIILFDKEVRDPKDATKVLVERGDKRIKAAVKSHKDGLREELQLIIRLLTGALATLEPLQKTAESVETKATAAHEAMVKKIKGMRETMEKIKAPLPSAEKTLKEAQAALRKAERGIDADEIAKRRKNVAAAEEAKLKIETEHAALGKQVAALEDDDLKVLSRAKVSAVADKKELNELVKKFKSLRAKLTAHYYLLPALRLNLTTKPDSRLPVSDVIYRKKIQTVQQLLQLPLEELGVPAGVRGVLEAKGVKTVGQLFEKTDRELEEIFKGDKKTIPYFKQELAKVGLEIAVVVRVVIESPEKEESRSEVRSGERTSRRQFLVRSAAGIAAAVLAFETWADEPTRLVVRERGDRLIELDSLQRAHRKAPPTTKEAEQKYLKKLQRLLKESAKAIEDRLKEHDIKWNVSQIRRLKTDAEKEKVTRDTFGKYQTFVQSEVYHQEEIISFMVAIMSRTEDLELLEDGLEVLEDFFKQNQLQNFIKFVYPVFKPYDKRNGLGALSDIVKDGDLRSKRHLFAALKRLIELRYTIGLSLQADAAKLAPISKEHDDLARKIKNGEEVIGQSKIPEQIETAGRAIIAARNRRDKAIDDEDFDAARKAAQDMKDAEKSRDDLKGKLEAQKETVRKWKKRQNEISPDRTKLRGSVRVYENRLTELDRLYASILAYFYAVPVDLLNLRVSVSLALERKGIKTVKQIYESSLDEFRPAGRPAAGLDKVKEYVSQTDHGLHDPAAGIDEEKVKAIDQLLRPLGLALPRAVSASKRSEVRTAIVAPAALPVVSSLDAQQAFVAQFRNAGVVTALPTEVIAVAKNVTWNVFDSHQKLAARLQISVISAIAGILKSTLDELAYAGVDTAPYHAAAREALGEFAWLLDHFEGNVDLSGPVFASQLQSEAHLDEMAGFAMLRPRGDVVTLYFLDDPNDANDQNFDVRAAEQQYRAVLSPFGLSIEIVNLFHATDAEVSRRIMKDAGQRKKSKAQKAHMDVNAERLRRATLTSGFEWVNYEGLDSGLARFVLPYYLGDPLKQYTVLQLRAMLEHDGHSVDSLGARYAAMIAALKTIRRAA